VFEDTLGGAADQQIIHRAMPVRSHHDQVCINHLSLIQDFLGHGTGGFKQGNFQAGLRDFSLPFCELRFPAFILRN